MKAKDYKRIKPTHTQPRRMGFYFDNERQAMQAMKSREQKMKEADERNAARAKRTPVAQLRRLDQKLGAGIGARKERAQLLQQINN